MNRIFANLGSGNRYLAASMVILLCMSVPVSAATRQPARPAPAPAVAASNAAVPMDQLPPQLAPKEGPDPWAGIMAQDIPEPAAPAGDAAYQSSGASSPQAAAGSMTEEFDMAAAARRGLAVNPQILAVRSKLLGKEYSRKAALGEMGFKIDLDYGYMHRNRDTVTTATTTSLQQQDTYTLGIGATQPIFAGFKLLSSYQRARLAREQAVAQVADAELKLVLDIQTAFLQLLRGRMDIRSAQDAVTRLESQLKVARAFYDVGLKPRLDVLQSEVELATAQQNLLAARNRAATQYAKLHSLLDLPVNLTANYVGDLGYSPFELPLETCLDRAHRQRPDLTIARRSVEIAEKDVRIAASDFYPHINATARWETAGDDWRAAGSDLQPNDFSQWRAGASLNWNLFEWGATVNNYRAAKQGVTELEAEAANARLNADFQVRSNLLNIQSARDRIRVARTSLVAAREGFRNALARYQAQVGTLTEVLDAQARVSESEAQISLAVTDYQTAIASLYNSIGEPNLSLVSRQP